MKERGILFSRSMVQAIREERKTMTRWLVQPQPSIEGQTSNRNCPYGVPGDRLWVRETWHPCDGGALFAADYPEGDAGKREAGVQRWYPGIHLRRVDARTLLEVTAVRVERLRDISDEDVIAEGVAVYPFMKGYHADGLCRTAAQECFRQLWTDINDERAPWRSNPWVWVVSFRRLP